MRNNLRNSPEGLMEKLQRVEKKEISFRGARISVAAAYVLYLKMSEKEKMEEFKGSRGDFVEDVLEPSGVMEDGDLIGEFAGYQPVSEILKTQKRSVRKMDVQVDKMKNKSRGRFAGTLMGMIGVGGAFAAGVVFSEEIKKGVDISRSGGEKVGAVVSAASDSNSAGVKVGKVNKNAKVNDGLRGHQDQMYSAASLELVGKTLESDVEGLINKAKKNGTVFEGYDRTVLNSKFLDIGAVSQDCAAVKLFGAEENGPSVLEEIVFEVEKGVTSGKRDFLYVGGIKYKVNNEKGERTVYFEAENQQLVEEHGKRFACDTWSRMNSEKGKRFECKIEGLEGVKLNSVFTKIDYKFDAVTWTVSDIVWTPTLIFKEQGRGFYAYPVCPAGIYKSFSYQGVEIKKGDRQYEVIGGALKKLEGLRLEEQWKRAVGK